MPLPQVRTLTRTYKTLLAAAKLHTPPKPDRGASSSGVASAAAAAAVTQDFQRLVGAVNKELTPTLYTFISDAAEVCWLLGCAGLRDQHSRIPDAAGVGSADRSVFRHV